MIDAVPDWGVVAPLALLLVVMVADGLIGGLPGLTSLLGAPLSGIRALSRWFDARLNRERRGRGARRMRGLIVVVVVILLAGTAGIILDHFARLLPYGWIMEAFMVWALLRQRDGLDRARRVASALEAGDSDVARNAVQPLVRYDALTLDDFGTARAAVEGGVSRFTEGCIGTMFWYALLGLPALCAFRAVGAVADVLGQPSPRHAAFGFVAARLDDALNLVPAIVAGPVLAVAAMFVPRTSPLATLKGWARDLGDRGARSTFRAEGAMAGALGLALGGPRPIDGGTLPGTWIGDGRARATTADIRRSIFLITVGYLLVAVLLALAVIVRTG